MKRRLHIFRQLCFLALAVWTAGACQRAPLPSPVSGEETSVTFSVSVPGGSSKTLSAADENIVKTVDVLVFEEGGDFLYGARGIDVEAIDANSHSFAVKLKAGTNDLILLANVREALTNAYPTGIPAGTTRAEIEKALTLSVADKWNTDSSSDPYLHIPMFGDIRGFQIADRYPNGVWLPMMRMLAAVDVYNKATSEFSILTIQIYYRNTTGQLIPSTGNWTGTPSLRVDRPSIPVGSDGTPVSPTKGPLVYGVPEAGRYNPNSSIGDIYLFEAEGGSETTHPHHVCLVIEGKTSADAPSTFYRVDFLDDSGDYLAVMRNHRYIFNIVGIAGPGYDSPEEALLQKHSNIAVDVEVWNEQDIDSEPGDPQYYLSVDTRKIVIDHTSNNQASFTIHTDYPEWSFVFTEDNPQTLLDRLGFSYQPGVLYPSDPDGVIFTFYWEGALPSIIQSGSIYIRAGNMRLRQTIEVGIRERP